MQAPNRRSEGCEPAATGPSPTMAALLLLSQLLAAAAAADDPVTVFQPQGLAASLPTNR